MTRTHLSREGDRAELLWLSALLLFALWYALSQVDLTLHPVEDAAILMRYARHLAEGHGIVWNIGEAPVDGATDFFFMVVLAAVHRLGVSLEGAVHLLGLASHLATVALVYLAIRALPLRSRWLALFAAAFLAMGPGIRYVEAYFGTPFFALWGALTWYLANRLARGQATTGMSLAFALAGLAAGLTRPEGVFLAALMMASILYWRGWRGARRTLLIFAAVFLVLGGAYLLWRWHYFGYPLPNPFYKKGGGRLYAASLESSLANAWGLAFPFDLALFYAAALILYARVRRALQIMGARGEATVCRALQAAGMLALLLALAGLMRRSSAAHATLLWGRYSLSYALLLGVLLAGGVSAVLAATPLARRLAAATALPVMNASAELRHLERETLFALIPLGGFALLWVLLSNEMNYLMRFQYVLLPVFLLSLPYLVTALAPFWPWMQPIEASEARRSAARVLLLLLMAVILYRQHQDMRVVSHHRDGLYDAALLLRQYEGRGYTLATTESGLVPLYSRWRTVDAWGLNDQWIAHHAGVTEAYLDRYQPEVILFHAYFSPIALPASTRRDAWQQMDLTLLQYATKRGYILAAAYGDSAYDTHYYYVRPAFPDSAAIVAGIRQLDYIWYGTGRRSVNYALLAPTE